MMDRQAIPDLQVHSAGPLPAVRRRAQRSANAVQHAHTGGFTLVEVLVAVLVISIGLLGVARLVLAAVKANDSAYFRTQAANLAYSMLDEMRANRAFAMTSPGYQVGYGTYADPGYSCAGTVCTPAQIAAYDLYSWKQQLNSGAGGSLPQGDGKIVMSFPSGSGEPTATITIKWDDSLAQWAFGTPSTTTPTVTTFTLESAL